MYIFRLENIVNGNNHVIGYELLSKPLNTYGKSIEKHFAELSDLEQIRLLLLQIEYLKKYNDITLSININLSSFYNQKFVDVLEKEFYQLKKENRLIICLELSENNLGSIFDDYIIEVVKYFRTLSFNFWIDDFGTGESNFIFLMKTLHLIDTIKIDKFVFWELFKNGPNLLYNLIEYITKKNKDVIIEGIETVEQHALLKVNSRLFGQGYFYQT
ncbi:EAL domain-containing protein [Vibrio crassostreae]|uniref:EAL domain-containing protein n=1 Tax=Vibrio crassostreae TaxID=246167 RepID=UPI0010498B29|nr:EAL domain-containing protein [Vibrio crassostreae]TCN88481.1 EAL domain-containing protein [Vibrio crassostreae]